MSHAAILAAREQRASDKKQLLTQWRVVVSLSFNVPGLPKSTPLIRAAFANVAQILDHFFCAHRCGLLLQSTIGDAAGDHALWAGNSSWDDTALKALTERFEGEHPLGRLLDVDVYTATGPIHSGKRKPCLICEQPALVCMRSQRHSLTELRRACDHTLSRWWAEQRYTDIARCLSRHMTHALLQEVLLTPKPGLVDQQDNGSHNDMDLPLFISAVSALAPFWEQVAHQGIRFDGQHWQAALISLRQLGLQMEAAMREATCGTNTHKGAIFVGCFAVFAVAHAWHNCSLPTHDDYRRIIRALGQDIIDRDLATLDEAASYGQRLLHTYKEADVGGPRYQVEHGLPAVFEIGLPALQHALAQGLSHKQSQLYSLFTLMGRVLDTNVLHRSSLETTRHFMALAQQAIINLPIHAGDIAALQNFCQQHWVSPGGCADLLAMTLFFHAVDTEIAFDDPSQ